MDLLFPGRQNVHVAADSAEITSDSIIIGPYILPSRGDSIFGKICIETGITEYDEYYCKVAADGVSTDIVGDRNADYDPNKFDRYIFKYNEDVQKMEYFVEKFDEYSEDIIDDVMELDSNMIYTTCGR